MSEEKKKTEVAVRREPQGKPATKRTARKKPKTKALVARPLATVAKPQNVSAEYLIAEGIKKGMPLETMERLLALRRQLKEEWAKERFFAALSRFQAECPVIAREQPVFDKDRKTVRFRYAPLGVIVDEVKAILERHGFSYTIKSELKERSVTATCYLHHAEGHTEESTFLSPIDEKAYMNEPQKVASAQTYAKRYAFCNACGILTADFDDDGRGAGDMPDQEPPKVEPAKQQKEEETVPINVLCDNILNKLRAPELFTEAQRFAMENRLMELYKQKSIAGMQAFERDVDRQIKFKERKDGSKGSAGTGKAG